MTTHTRQKVRDAVALLLQGAGLANVYTGRAQPNASAKLPLAVVETSNETSSRHVDQWRELRTVQVYIRLYAMADEHLDNTLDTLAAGVENLLCLDQTLGGIIESWDYKGCDADTNSAARQEAGSLSMQFECMYLWAPTPAVNNLATMNFDIDMANPRNDPPQPYGPDGQLDAQVSITLPA